MKKIIMIVVFLVLSSGAYFTVMAERLALIETSGMIFKDKLEVLAFDDPDIKGVTCFITMPKRSLSFEDQTNTSISCRKISKISGLVGSKKKIFRGNKSLFFKSMYVDRVYDKKRSSLLYVSYTEKLSGDNASNSISVVTLDR